MDEVERQLDSTQDETSRAGMQYRLCMLAVTCAATFDVCPEHVPAILSSEEDFSIVMRCAVIAHNNAQVNISRSNHGVNVRRYYLNRMLRRHYRLLHSLEPIFNQSFTTVLSRAELIHGGAYDDALTQLWVGYRPRNSSSWKALPDPNSRWISCVVEGRQNVHYDLLTGELRIGGKRLVGLPKEIVNHPTYKMIFGTVSGQI